MTANRQFRKKPKDPEGALERSRAISSAPTQSFPYPVFPPPTECHRVSRETMNFEKDHDTSV